MRPEDGKFIFWGSGSGTFAAVVVDFDAEDDGAGDGGDGVGDDEGYVG